METTKKNRIVDAVVFYILSFIFIAPCIIGSFNLYKERGLDGAVFSNPDTTFTIKGWKDGTWQPMKEVYLNSDFGFHNLCIRIHNEIDYQLFHKGHARNLVFGKNGYLYEQDYILTYLGKDYVGQSEIRNYIEKCKRAETYLSSKGKTMFIVLAAGKGSFYPEFFPEPYASMSKSKSNYEEFIEQSVNARLNFIDFSTYFRRQKETSTYLLYPKNGTHWSQYGMTLVADSIVKYIEEKRSIQMAHLSWDNIIMEKAGGMDYDIASGLNLLTYLEGPIMGYPEVKYESKDGKTAPKLLVISDSFFMGIYYMGFDALFNKEDFWYYNKKVYPEIPGSIEFADQLNFEKEIDSHDVFMLMASEHNIAGVGWGFIDQVLQLADKDSAQVKF